jgi:hypothetical protein
VRHSGAHSVVTPADLQNVYHDSQHRWAWKASVTSLGIYLVLFYIRRVEVKHIQICMRWRVMPLADPRFSSGSARRLSKHGIRGTGRTNLTRVLITWNATGTRALANSSHPSSREGHHSAGCGTRALVSPTGDLCVSVRCWPATSPLSNAIRCRRSTCDA